MTWAAEWTDELIERVGEILRWHNTAADALPVIERTLGLSLTKDSLRRGFLSRGRSPGEFLGRRDTMRMKVAEAVELPDDSETTAPSAPPSQPPVVIVDDVPSAPHERFAALVDLVKRSAKHGGISLEQLCDELGMSPKVARGYLADAREVGITIDVAHERLLFRPPEPSPSAPAMAVTPSIIPGRDHRIGVFSDLHFGSNYCLRAQFRDFVLRCYHELGIRDFFCPGDVLEGYYRHAAFERSAESWEGQAIEFLEWLPELEGMRIFFIDGNHDFTWTDRTGVESGRNLVRLARERGRNDLHFFGSRGALVQYGDTRIELWHPKKGKAYAISYQLQNKIRDTAPARLPNILLCGHVHEYVKFLRSAVWAFYAATFQHGDAPYGRSIGGDVAMGGLVIDWRVDSDGVVRTLSDSFYLAQHEPRVFDVAI
jgi:UDP-2,3-diacylglucosamine pyrophosphatase LpxH